jgi:hypothetical protein
MLGHRLNLAAAMMAASFSASLSGVMPNDMRLQAASLASSHGGSIQRPPRTGTGFAAVKRAAKKRRNVLRNRAMHRGSSKRRS